MRSIPFFCGLAAVAAVTILSPHAALADGASALAQAAITSYKQTSYHTTFTAKSGAVIEGDIVNPDRSRVVGNGMEMITVGGSMYMKHNGAWSKIPGVDPMKLQRDPLKAFADAKGKFAVVDLGPKVVGGASLHAYQVTNLATRAVTSVYVDTAGRISRIESATGVTTISKFGEAVSIEAPM